MVRAGLRAPSTGRAPSVNRMRKNREKPYKVQFESVMTKKKKLKLLDIHGSAKPLRGYTYLPVGFAELAEECKELSRKRDADVAVVSAGSRAAAIDPSKLSHHIYRVGYHFRTDVFDDACAKLGYSERNGKLEKTGDVDHPTRFEQTMSRYGSRFDNIDINNRSEEESMKVKKHIRELFPKIPEADLEEIYIRAWEQGARTVGNANDLSLSRQVQLATIARIRHTYTDYDHLLRVGSWKEARTAVEHKCLAKLIEWRGEHDHDPEELEEILRETIVIDDESDDDDVTNEAATNDDDDSDTSLEILQQTIAPKDLRVEPNEMSSFRRTDPPRSRNQAALQARWQSARSARYGPPIPQHEAASASRITVALDNDGKAPRSFQSGGIQYTRIDADLEPMLGPQHIHEPGLGGYRSVPCKQPVPPPEQSSLNRWSNVGDFVAANPTRNPANQKESLTMAAVPSIEKPYNGSSSARHAYNEEIPFIDLTTPPKSKLWEVRNDMASAQISHEEQLRHGPMHMHQRNNEIRYMHVRPRSQGPVSGSAHSRPALPRHQSGVETVDLSRPRENPIPVEERPIYQDYGDAHHKRPHAMDQVYRQPVYGQAAYPQMLSQYSSAPPTPPRPVHGAPSSVQPAFGVPSPQRFFIGKQPAYRLPDR